MKLLNKKQFGLSILVLFILWILSPLILNYTHRFVVEYKMARKYSNEIKDLEVLNMNVVRHHYGSMDELCGMWGFGAVEGDREKIEDIMTQRDREIKNRNIFNHFHFFRYEDGNLLSLHVGSDDRIVTQESPYDTAFGIEFSDYLYPGRHNGEDLLKNKDLLKSENSYLVWKEGVSGSYLYCNPFLFFDSPLVATKDLFSDIFLGW